MAVRAVAPPGSNWVVHEPRWPCWPSITLVTMPWGNRSILFRDPDGNLVNFFTPVTEDAIKKFDA